MTTVAVLGGGAGGSATTVDLTLSGHQVRLWNRRRATIEPLIAAGNLHYTGVLGSGALAPELVTTDLADVLHGADVVVICQPAPAHEALFAELARLSCTLPIVLDPGHTGGALHARAVFAAHATPLPPIAELSTLTYVARKPAADDVTITGKAGRVHAAPLPGGEIALRHAVQLFPAATAADDVLATSLANVNLVLHPPGAILAAAWIEATTGEFTFYVQAMTNGVVRIMQQLDDERIRVGRAFGHELPPLLTEMSAIGTVEQPAHDLGSAIRDGGANANIKAPDSFAHRYYQEDFPYGLVPFIGLARTARVPVPVAHTLLRLGEFVTGEHYSKHGLNPQRLAIAGCTARALQRLVRVVAAQ